MKILIVDDELSMREFLTVLMSTEGHETAAASSLAEAGKAMSASDFDLVITDMKLGADTGMSVLQAARARGNAPEVIVVTAFGTVNTALEAIRRGAYDYIAKPFDNEEFKLVVQRALEKRAVVQANEALKRTLVAEGRELVLGNSRAISEVWALVQKVAMSPRATVLITGESGTGKELIARSIHFSSQRAGQPFVALNCGAMNEGTLESELFGHMKGSFTGAIADRKGLLTSAGEGTVFLDEIGEVSPALQVKLLRVLQERKLRPVGGNQEVPYQARILAATNRNLEAEVQAGRFREDLFHRLNVINIEVPPLRARREDIRPLAQAFLSQLAEELGRPGLFFTESSLEMLEKFTFSGNVRQLQNMVERAATLAEGNELGPEAWPAAVRGEKLPNASSGNESLEPGFSLERHLDDLEQSYLRTALVAAKGVKTQAAELLGLTFRSFRYRLAKHGLGDEE